MSCSSENEGISIVRTEEEFIETESQLEVLREELRQKEFPVVECADEILGVVEQLKESEIALTNVEVGSDESDELKKNINTMRQYLDENSMDQSELNDRTEELTAIRNRISTLERRSDGLKMKLMEYLSRQAAGGQLPAGGESNAE
jgi:predicted RNase H-like nuclease (RuvC/YqgF family)